MLCWQGQDEKEIQFPSSVQSLASLTINKSACFAGVFLFYGNSSHRNRTGNHQIALQPADGNGCVSSPLLALANNVEVKTPALWSISVCFIHLFKISSLKFLWPDLRGRYQSTALWRVSFPEGGDRGQFSFLIFLQMGMLNIASIIFYHYSWKFGSVHINQANLVAASPIQQNSFTEGEGIHGQGWAAGSVGTSPTWCVGDSSVLWFPAARGGQHCSGFSPGSAEIRRHETDKGNSVPVCCHPAKSFWLSKLLLWLPARAPWQQSPALCAQKLLSKMGTVEPACTQHFALSHN